MVRIRKLMGVWLIAMSFMSLIGCGALGETALQGGEASLLTLVDLLLTDFSNQVADALEADEGQAADDISDGDDDDGNDDDGIIVDDPVLNGEMIFTANGCTACHCADAGGGCALDAPALVGISADSLDDRLRGDTPHPGGKFDFDDLEIADLEAYLASL